MALVRCFSAFLILFLAINLQGQAVEKDEEYGEFDDNSEEAIIESPISKVATLKDLEKYIDPPDVIFGGAVIGLFASESDDLREFEAFARPLDGNGYRFAVSVGPNAVLDHYGVKAGWKIYIHPPRRYISEAYKDKTKFRFGGQNLKSEAGKGSLKAFINKHYLPLASRISPIVGNERIFVEQRLPIFIVIGNFDEDRDPKGVAYMLNRLRKIGETYREKMLFAIIDSEDADSTMRFQKRFFLPEETEENDIPEKIIGIKHDKAYYSISSAFSVENGIRFIEDFFQEKIKPVTVQEEMIDVPEEQETFNHMDL